METVKRSAKTKTTTPPAEKISAPRAKKQPAKKATEKKTQKHPGEILRDLFMTPTGLKANRLALVLHVPPQRIGEIINGHRGITAETALRLAILFGTTARFWLDLQADYELSQAEQKWSSIIARQVIPIGDRSLASKKPILPPSSASKQKENGGPDLAKLPATEKKVYKVIPADDLVSFDEIYAKTGLNAGEISSALTMLELDNLVQRHIGDLYKRTAGSS
jgi:addiction module HigA family antidote